METITCESCPKRFIATNSTRYCLTCQDMHDYGPETYEGLKCKKRFWGSNHNEGRRCKTCKEKVWKDLSL